MVWVRSGVGLGLGRPTAHQEVENKSSAAHGGSLGHSATVFAAKDNRKCGEYPGDDVQTKDEPRVGRDLGKIGGYLKCDGRGVSEGVSEREWVFSEEDLELLALDPPEEPKACLDGEGPVREYAKNVLLARERSNQALEKCGHHPRVHNPLVDCQARLHVRQRETFVSQRRTREGRCREKPSVLL